MDVFICDDTEASAVEAVYCSSGLFVHVPRFTCVSQRGAHGGLVKADFKGCGKAMISPQVVQVTKNRLGNVHPVLYIGGVIAIALKATAKVCK